MHVRLQVLVGLRLLVWLRVRGTRGHLAGEFSCRQRPARLPGGHAVARLPHGEACRGVANIRHESEA